MQMQPRLSPAEWNALRTWRPPASFYSTWPAHRPLDDRSPWWREFSVVSKPVRSMKLAPAAFERHVDEIAAYMGTLANPFNGEASGRHCVRVRLVLTGAWPWREADLQAGEVVEEALRRCGCAERPSWAEGQPDWCQPGFDPVERAHCIRCGRRIRDGHTSRAGQKFCSNICATAEYHARARDAYARALSVEYVARDVARRSQPMEIACQHCGKQFQLSSRNAAARFCSIACGNAGKRRRQRTVFVYCLGCDGLIGAIGVHRRYCSNECCRKHRGAVAAAKRQPDEDADDGQSTARRCA